MASIGNDPGGRRRIIYNDREGKRKTIRLGKMDKDNAIAIKLKVEALITAQIGGKMAPKLAEWLETIPEWLYERIARTGLIESRGQKAPPLTLGGFLDEVFAAMTTKQSTLTAYSHTRRCMTEFWGKDKPLSEIGPRDAEKFRQFLKTPTGLSERYRENRKGAGLSEATTARRTSIARMIFRKGVQWRLIESNPFAEVKAGSQKNKARMRFIDRETAQKILDACPNNRWKLIFSLARFGGVRIPSEIANLRWSDVNFERGVIRITSPKTEHHAGKGERWLPIFPELEKPLTDAFAEAEEGAELVIPDCETNSNLRTQLGKIIHRAGLSAWPRLFANLRSSRQSELAQQFPIHVVCEWIGNSREVALDHYLQVTDHYLALATGKAAINPAQSAGEISVQSGTPASPDPGNAAKTAIPACGGGSKMGAAGFEPAKA